MAPRITILILLFANEIFSEEDSGWKPLFDGQSLAGWVDGSGNPVTKGWEVRDGALHRVERGGDIFTVDAFGDFDLAFEWKVSPGANSGVKYKVKRFGNSWLGPEYQILDDAEHSNGKVAKTSAGSIYALFAPGEKRKALKPVGEWNTGRIVVRGSVFQHWLNGEMVVEVDTGSEAWKSAVAASKFKNVDGYALNDRGRIMLQDHGDEVWFRNLRVREVRKPQ